MPFVAIPLVRLAESTATTRLAARELEVAAREYSVAQGEAELVRTREALLTAAAMFTIVLEQAGQELAAAGGRVPS